MGTAIIFGRLTKSTRLVASRKPLRAGVLKSGLMYECVQHGVQYVLAGSIRDDGPLVDVITDCVQAQKKYIAALEDVAVVLMLASTLHSIAVGNLLKGSVKTVCVDINEATPMKLSNRGSKQAIGVVTDVSFFLSILAGELKKYQQEAVGQSPAPRFHGVARTRIWHRGAWNDEGLSADAHLRMRQSN